MRLPDHRRTRISDRSVAGTATVRSDLALGSGWRFESLIPAVPENCLRMQNVQVEVITLPFGTITMAGFAAGLVLQVLSPSLDGGIPSNLDTLLSPQAIGVWHPNDEVLDYRADHASAMMQSRWKGESYRLWRRDAPFDVPWTWVSKDGGAIRRVGDGEFLLTTATTSRDWFADTRCYAAGWPMFFCNDGRERVMSAPDLTTTIFDEVSYHRVLPHQNNSAMSPAAESAN